MAFSYAVTVASGLTAAVAVPFQYIDKAHVHVTLDGVLVDDDDLVWANPAQITLPSIPVAGTAVKVYRETPITEQYVTWPTPGTFSADTLNRVEKFLRLGIQEAYDTGSLASDLAEEYLVILDQVADLAAQVAEDANATGIGSAIAVEARIAAEAARDAAQAIAAGSATAITFTPAGNLASTNVQAALQELDTEKAASTHTHAQSDITGLVAALSTINSTLLTLAPKASPVFTGSAAKATTPGSSSDTNDLATTEWVRDRIAESSGGGWEFIDSTTISSPASEVVMDAGTTKTYRELYVGWTGLSGSANADLRAVFSTDNGSTFDTGSNYRYKTYSGSPGTRAFQIVADAFGAAGSVTGFLKLELNFDNCPKPVELGSDSNNMGFTYLNYTAVVNAIKLYFASGNVDAGTIVLYGRP